MSGILRGKDDGESRCRCFFTNNVPPMQRYGKNCILIMFICLLQALVDRPDEVRRPMNFKRLVITDFKVDIPRLAKKAVLKKALEESDVFAKFAASSWGQKIAKREAKANMTDFDRHMAAVNKMKRSAKVRRAFNKLKKSA